MDGRMEADRCVDDWADGRISIVSCGNVAWLPHWQGLCLKIITCMSLQETYFQVASQHRSVWTHEMDLRPFDGVAWFNTSGANKL